MARQAKEANRGNLANKFDAQGRSLLDIDNERKASEKAYADMIKAIDETVRYRFLSINILPQKHYRIRSCSRVLHKFWLHMRVPLFPHTNSATCSSVSLKTRLIQGEEGGNVGGEKESEFFKEKSRNTPLKMLPIFFDNFQRER
jgi:hypothetical protein